MLPGVLPLEKLDGADAHDQADWNFKDVEVTHCASVWVNSAETLSKPAINQ